MLLHFTESQRSASAVSPFRLAVDRELAAPRTHGTREHLHCFTVLSITHAEIGRKFDTIVKLADVERFLDTPLSEARETEMSSINQLKRLLRPYYLLLRPYYLPILQFLNPAFRTTLTPLTHKEIARLVGRPDPTIVEIGCNNGTDTLDFMEAMPMARVYCFEPDPRAILRFKQNLGSRFERVSLSEIAISDRNGTIAFHMSGNGPVTGKDWDKSGSIRAPKNHLLQHPSVTFGKIITVKTRTLDSWCAEHGVTSIDFLWMDVQGAEGDVIAGAKEILKRTRFLYTEYSNYELYEGQLPLIRLLARLPAFRVLRLYPGDVLLRNRSGSFSLAWLRLATSRSPRFGALSRKP